MEPKWAWATRLIGRLSATSAGWSCILQQNGLRVFCAGIRPGSSEPYPLHEDAGVLLGAVFVREAADAKSPKAQFGALEDAIV